MKDSEAAIPYDEEAEWMVVALSLASPSAARDAASRLDRDEFYRPALADAFATAVQLRSIDGIERRIALVSQASGIRRADLAARVSERVGPVERWTRKVRSAARRRRVMALAARLYNGAACAELSELVALVCELGQELEAISSDPRPPARAANIPTDGRALGYFRREPGGADS